MKSEPARLCARSRFGWALLSLVAVPIGVAITSCSSEPNPSAPDAGTDAGPKPEPDASISRCGNGEQESGEECDGQTDLICPPALGLGRAFCTSDCVVDDSGCGTPPALSIDADNATPCAIRSDGRSQCWGYNWYNGAAAPLGGDLLQWDSMATRAFALTTAGRVVPSHGWQGLWGDGFVAVTTVPSTAMACGLHATGRIMCVADSATDAWDRVDVPGRYLAVQGGVGGLCALDELGWLHCWTLTGSETPDETSRWAHEEVGDPAQIAIVSGQGGPSACAFYQDQPPVCVGAPLRAGHEPPLEPMTHVGFGTKWGDYGCGLRATDGMPICWGEYPTDRDPLVGGGPLLPGESVLDPPAIPLVDLAVSGAVCGTTGQELHCWGGRGRFEVGPVEVAEPIKRIEGVSVSSTQQFMVELPDNRIARMLLQSDGTATTEERQRTDATLTEIVGKSYIKLGLTDDGRTAHWGTRQPTSAIAQHNGDYRDVAFTLVSGACAVHSTGMDCDKTMPVALQRFAKCDGPFNRLCGFDGDEQLQCLRPSETTAYGLPGAYRLAAVADTLGLACGASATELQCHGAGPDPAEPFSAGFDNATDIAIVNDTTVCLLDEAGSKFCTPDLGSPTSGRRYLEIERYCDLAADGEVLCLAAPPAPEYFRGAHRIVVGGSMADSGLDNWCVLWPDGHARCGGARGVEEPLATDGITAYDRSAFAECVTTTDDPGVRCRTHPSWAEAVPPTIAATDFSVGMFNICVVREDGGLQCWDSDSDSELHEPEAGSFVDVAVGYNDTCALTHDGDIRCWVAQYYERPALLAPDMEDVAQIEVGANFMCVRSRAGEVACATDGSFELEAPDRVFSKIAAGYYHVCGLVEDGAIVCFDRSPSGDRYPVLFAPTEDGFTDIGSANGFSCAVAPGRPLRCWGKIWYD